jgi:hypothetical protein
MRFYQKFSTFISPTLATNFYIDKNDIFCVKHLRANFIFRPKQLFLKRKKNWQLFLWKNAKVTKNDNVFRAVMFPGKLTKLLLSKIIHHLLTEKLNIEEIAKFLFLLCPFIK